MQRWKTKVGTRRMCDAAAPSFLPVHALGDDKYDKYQQRLAVDLPNIYAVAFLHGIMKKIASNLGPWNHFMSCIPVIKSSTYVKTYVYIYTFFLHHYCKNFSNMSKPNVALHNPYIYESTLRFQGLYRSKSVLIGIFRIGIKSWRRSNRRGARSLQTDGKHQ